MTYYTFANCVLYDAPFQKDMYTKMSVSNMRTEGILRLLAGESFALHPDDRAHLLSSPAWAEFYKKQSVYRPDIPLEDYHRFDAIDPQADDVFLWSPFADALCSYTTARCADGSVYPSLYWPISDVFEHGERIPFERVTASWQALMDRLSHIKKKAVVLYPPDFLCALEGDTKHHRELTAHIQRYNETATSVFRAQGWQVFTPLLEGNPHLIHWSHYSDASRAQLWKQIGEWVEG